MSLPVAIIGLFLLAALTVGGHAGWSYYRLLDRVHALSTALDQIHRHRGTSRITVEELRSKSIAAIKARGATASPSDVTVKMTPLTPQTAASLPALWRTRLNMACYHRRIQDVQDTRIGNRIARIRGQPSRTRPVPSTAPPSLHVGSGVTCAPHRLHDLDYTFVLVQANAHVAVSWFSRTVNLERRFYLDQRPDESKEKDGDTEDVDDPDEPDEDD